MIKDTRIRPYCIITPKKRSPEIMPFSVERSKEIIIIDLT